MITIVYFKSNPSIKLLIVMWSNCSSIFTANCFQEFSGAKQGAREVRRSPGSQLCHPVTLHHCQHEQEDCHRLQHLQRQDGVPLQLRRHVRVAWRHGGNWNCPGANFTNILWAAFLYLCCHSFTLLTDRLYIFWQKISAQKLKKLSCT